MTAVRAATVLCVVAALASAAGAHDRPGNRWTEKQASSVRALRGVTLASARCTGLDGARRRSPAARHRHFRCVGWFAPGFAPKLRVRVRYVLHPLARYRRVRPPFVESNVRFDSFGVP